MDRTPGPKRLRDPWGPSWAAPLSKGGVQGKSWFPHLPPAPPSRETKGHRGNCCEGRDPTGLETNPSGGSLSKRQPSGFPVKLSPSLPHPSPFRRRLPSSARRRAQGDRPVMLTGFQLSAHLRLRSLLHSGWERGKFAKAKSRPSPGDPTKAPLTPTKLNPPVGAETKRDPSGSGPGGGGWRCAVGVATVGWGGLPGPAGRGVPGGVPPPLPHAASRHLSGAGDSAAPGPARAAGSSAARSRPPAPPAAARSAERRGEPSAHGVMLPATTLRRIVTGSGETRGARRRGATAGSTHTQPRPPNPAGAGGHVPAESPRDRPRSHKAPRSGQGREGAGPGNK